MEPRRSGKLTVIVLEAADLDRLGSFAPDSFCQVDPVGDPSIDRTRTITGTCTPRWNQELSFTVQDIGTARLTVQVWDESFKVRDLMGRCVIPLGHLTPETGVVEWHDLDPVPGVRHGGRVQLHLVFSTSRRFTAHGGSPRGFTTPVDFTGPPTKGPPVAEVPPAQWMPGRHGRQRR
jgi:hypothetical protein